MLWSHVIKTVHQNVHNSTLRAFQFPSGPLALKWPIRAFDIFIWKETFIKTAIFPVRSLSVFLGSTSTRTYCTRSTYTVCSLCFKSPTYWEYVRTVGYVQIFVHHRRSQITKWLTQLKSNHDSYLEIDSTQLDSRSFMTRHSWLISRKL